MQHYLTRSILALTLTLTTAGPVLANSSRKSHGPPGHSMRDFERSRGNGRFKNKHKVRYDRIEYRRDRRDYAWELARRERLEGFERARLIRLERERSARIERARYERERLARVERARRERDRIIRARQACYDYDRAGLGRRHDDDSDSDSDRYYGTRDVHGRDRDRDSNGRDRADVLRDRATDIILGNRGNRSSRCDDRRNQRPRVVMRDPRNWPDQRDWPVPTYPRYFTGSTRSNALATAQRALEILRTAP